MNDAEFFAAAWAHDPNQFLPIAEQHQPEPVLTSAALFRSERTMTTPTIPAVLIGRLTSEEYLTVLRLIREYGEAHTDRSFAVRVDRIEPGGEQWTRLYRQGEDRIDRISDILLGRPTPTRP